MLSLNILSLNQDHTVHKSFITLVQVWFLVMVHNSFDPLIWPVHFVCIIGKVSCKPKFPEILQPFVQFLTQDHPASRQLPIKINYILHKN